MFGLINSEGNHARDVKKSIDLFQGIGGLGSGFEGLGGKGVFTCERVSQPADRANFPDDDHDIAGDTPVIENG